MTSGGTQCCSGQLIPWWRWRWLKPRRPWWVPGATRGRMGSPLALGTPGALVLRSREAQLGKTRWNRGAANSSPALRPASWLWVPQASARVRPPCAGTGGRASSAPAQPAQGTDYGPTVLPPRLRTALLAARAVLSRPPPILGPMIEKATPQGATKEFKERAKKKATCLSAFSPPREAKPKSGSKRCTGRSPRPGAWSAVLAERPRPRERPAGRTRPPRGLRDALARYLHPSELLYLV